MNVGKLQNLEAQSAKGNNLKKKLLFPARSVIRAFLNPPAIRKHLNLGDFLISESEVFMKGNMFFFCCARRFPFILVDSKKSSKAKLQ